LNIAYDIIIYSATPGGIAAAITAARASPSSSIGIIEPTSYIGGMAAAGGIGLRDLGLSDTSKLII
jgi:ribulose 1,5-bisphosphate synthetase/thiazole synthase